MRTLTLLVGLVALAWMSGCGEEPVVTAPAGPQAAAALADDAVPDLGRLPARSYDPAALQATVAGLAAQPRTGSTPVAPGLQITVPDPPNGIFTCQDGVDAAVPGATITVLPASVVEDVMLYVPNVTFRAQGTVEIHGNLIITADDVRVEGFSVLTPASPGLPVGIFVDGKDGAVIQGNTVAGWECGVLMMGGRNARIEGNRLLTNLVGVDLEMSRGNVVADNVFDQLVWGVYSVDSPANRIRDNALTNVVMGILLDHSNEGFILRNTIDATEIALLSMMGHYNEVSDNVVSGGNWGIELYDSHLNRYTDNKVVFARFDGILLDDANGNTFLRNDTLGPGDDGLDVHGGSNGNTIIGTVSLGHADNGIEFESRTHENFLANSKAHGNAGCDIVNLGTANVFQDNEADCTSGF